MMMLMSVSIMLFWTVLGVLAGLVSFLVSMIFLYKPLTGLNSYYYSVLIGAFFVNSFIGYYFSKKINVARQDYTVTTEKVAEDINLIKNHLNNRQAEVSAMGEKIVNLLRLKNISDSLSISLSEEEIIEIVSDETFRIFGGDTRILLFVSGKESQEVNLVATRKNDTRKSFAIKKGGIFDRWTVKNMKSLLVRDVRKDFRFSVDPLEGEDDAISLMIKPLVIENRVLGVLRVDSIREAAFEQYELRILDIIGELTAVAFENARLYRKTEDLAIRDSLTRLYVHRYFMERMEEEVKRALHSNSTFALIMMDIDNFKEFNDKHGHIPGDAVLRKVGNVLLGKVSAGDIVCRYGGEEFSFLLLNGNREEGLKLAEEIRTKIESTPIVLRREKCNITISAGVAVFPEDGRLREDLIWEADKYLYEAKEKSKNRVCTK